MKRIMSLVLCAAMLLSVLCGCSQDDPYVPTGDGLTWEDDVHTPEATDPLSEQELVLAYYPDQSMNPLQSTDFTNRVLFSLIYQGLFAVNSEYKATPILCKNYAISEDMRTYIFYVENASFSDGTLLSPEDVYATYVAAMESTYYGGRFGHVKDLYLMSDGGIVFILDTAYENFEILLDIPILKAEEVAFERPVGTGAYFLEEISTGLRLRRRANWWCDPDMAVTASSIGLTIAESPAQIRDEFQFGDVGLVCADPCSDSHADYRCDYELWDCENGVFLYLGCNMDSPVFSIPSIRSAITFAIDRDYIVSEFYGGFARSATLPASPMSPYYRKDLAERYQRKEGVLDQAVTDALISGDLEREHLVIFLVNKDDTLRLRVARAIGKMLQDAGLKVQMQELSRKKYQEALLYRQYDIYLGQTKLSPNMDLSPFFRRSGGMHYGGITDAGIYSMCLDALENSGNYYNLHKMVSDDGRICSILFQSYAVHAVRGLVTDLTPARDNVCYYTLGKALNDIRIEYAEPIPPETTEPEE